MTGPVQQPKKRMSPLAVVLALSGVFFVMFLIVSGVFFLLKSPSSGPRGTSPSSRLFSGGSVGIVELNGIIMDSKKTLARLERFEEDPDIKAIVVRMNSPGGAVAPSQEIYEAIRAYKKPLVVSMSSVAASGAYYAACGAKKIFANPGTMTGSIGVIMEFANLQKLYDWAKVQRYVVKTGKFKDIGSEHREMTPEEHKLMQAMVDDVLSQFKQAISTNRKLPMPQVTALADGRIFSGTQAKAAHLIDELGTLQDAVREAAKLGKIKGKPHVVYIEKKRGSLLDLILDEGSSPDGADSSSPAIATLQKLLHLLSREGPHELFPDSFPRVNLWAIGHLGY